MLPKIAVGSSLLTSAGASVPSFATKCEYIDAVLEAGGLPLILPALSLEQAGEALRGMDGLLLIGGPDLSPQSYGEKLDPLTMPMAARRERFDMAALQWAYRHDLPVLAICLGCQVLNVARQGTLYQDILAHRAGSICHSHKPSGYVQHRITIKSGSLLSGILGEGEMMVNSSHHQAVKDVGKGLVVSAVAEDGVIEAVEDPSKRFVLGVQWHPESLIGDPHHFNLFKSFVSAALK